MEWRWKGNHILVPSLAETRISHAVRPKELPIAVWPPGDPPRLAWLQLKVYRVCGEELAIPLPPGPGLTPCPALPTLNLCLFFWPWALPRKPLKGLKY